jgi:hypothetical protein
MGKVSMLRHCHENERDSRFLVQTQVKKETGE